MRLEKYNTYLRLDDNTAMKIYCKGREMYAGTYVAFLQNALDDFAEYYVDEVEEVEPGVFTYWVHENE